MTAKSRRNTEPWVIVETPAGRREISVYSEEGFHLLSRLWVQSGWHQRLSYKMTWLGIPVIQLPEDLIMMQEVLSTVRPDVVIETGTAHGGTAIFYASILELLGRGRVISIDVEIRPHNRRSIETHPMSRRIALVEGSSVSQSVVAHVRGMVRSDETVLLALDSNHSFDHVRAELEAYAPLVTPGSYVVVFDGVMETLADAPDGKPEWVADNPARAVRDFLLKHPEFEVDGNYGRLLVTYCPGGFLRRKIHASVATQRPAGV